jgi:hypothetical protein
MVCLGPASAVAEPTKLGGDHIKETFTGSRVELDTPLGTTIPIKFTGDGLMRGNAGSLASVLGAENDRGRWWIKGDRLCYKWFRWFDAEEQCLTIHLKDERVFWRTDDGKKGTATIVERATPSVAAVEKEPAATATKRVTRQAEASAMAPVPAKTKAQAPVLKSPPRLAVRPKSAAERLGIPDEVPADRSLFFVGLGMARALQSQYVLASAEAAPRPTPIAKPATRKAVAVPAPVKKAVAVPVPPPAAVASAYPYPEPETAAPIQTAAVAPSSFSVFGVEDDDVLNMRSGPSEEYAIIGFIPPNATAVRMAGRCIAAWCEIQFRGTRGWVNRYYLAQN